MIDMVCSQPGKVVYRRTLTLCSNRVWLHHELVLFSHLDSTPSHNLIFISSAVTEMHLEPVDVVKIFGVAIFFITLLSICCIFRYKEVNGVVPATPWTGRANHYMIRAKGRTDKRIYMKYQDGLWIHCTHSTC
ncbi:hypothetical protein HDE_02498 [Halotydeus destructor]|nr:hypothetical protein HDE_02498 [Halotydeus destructor]